MGGDRARCAPWHGGAGMDDVDPVQARYLRAKAIATAADALPPEDRQAHVVRECAGDDALRREVEWLLQALDSESTLPPPTWNAYVAPDRSGAQVVAAAASDYRILRRLGQGGMGVVYLAERNVGGAVQQVALKLVGSAGEPGPEVLRHFADERRILAGLDHPRIARLLDAGSTADGQPFLAMEYVQGQRIDVYCREQGLSLARRVGLFAKVCAAVQYAHQHLVVHRDIKPANILVDARGEPRLLDFGIARLLAEEGGEAALRTAAGQRALTLAYASPEQVLGESLTTASDIWSLGAVLYELVSGLLPFAAEESPLALSNAIVTGRVQPPSRRRDARDPAAAVPGYRIPADIDAVVLKAMRTAPGDRYATAAALGEDLERFLQSLPVQARRGAAWYRARLYLKRHRGAAAAVLALGMLLAGFGIERESQLRLAEQERDKAQALAGFMSELFENADPSRSRGERITVAEMLDKGVAELQGDTAMPAAVRVPLLLSIGRAYNALDRGDKALPVLRQARRLQAGYPAGTLERARVLAALGRAYSMLIDLPSAAQVDKEAIALLRQSPGAEPDEILRVRINQMYSELAVRQMPVAQIQEQLRQILAELHAQAAPDRELEVQALAAQAMALAVAGDDAQARARAGDALARATAFYGGHDPALIYYRFVQALVTIRVDPARAVALYRTIIADYDRVLDGNGPGLAGLLAYFGDALMQLGRYGDAAQAMQRALAISKTFAAQSPDFHDGTQVSLAEAMIELGRLDEAGTMLAGLAPRLRERAASGHAWAVGNFLQGLDLQARLAARRGQVGQALQLYREADEALDGHPDLPLTGVRGDVLSGLGQARLATGDRAGARDVLARLQALNARIDAPAYATSAIDAAWLEAALARADGDTAAAISRATPAAAIAAQRWGDDDRRSRALATLAQVATRAPATSARPAASR